MGTTASWLQYLNPGTLTGPIFVKELRVSSRRFRNYLVRLLYLGLLTLFAAMAWAETARRSDYMNALDTYSMPQVGQNVTLTIAWFQFVMLQLVAVVMASTSISDEIYHQTIHSLLTTPITSLQIVLGKLFSRLLQIVLLLVTTLPLLAVVRIFGGVPWDYLIATTSVTLTAALLAGCVSLFYSILFRRSYIVILMTLATGLVLYLLLPMLVVLAAVSSRSGPSEFLLHLNPPAMMSMLTVELLSSGRMMRGMGLYWWVHCLIMLGSSVLVLLPCVALVRRVCRRAGAGGDHPSEAPAIPAARTYRPAVQPPPPLPMPAGTLEVAGEPMRAGPMPIPDRVGIPPPPVPSQPAPAYGGQGTIRRVGDWPVLWRELHGRLVQGGRGSRILLWIFIGLIGLLYISIAGTEGDAFLYVPVHVSFIEAYVLMGLIAVATISATSISSEKETRSLPILLCTPLESWQIVAAKALGTLRRSLIGWSFLLVHTGLFVLAGALHPILLLFVVMLVFSFSVAVIGSGLLMSSLYKKTTTAIILNFIIWASLWGLLPILTVSITHDPPSPALNITNPFVQAGVLTAGSGGSSARWGYRARYDEDTYHWGLEDGASNRSQTMIYMMLSGWGYMAGGVGCMALAAMSLRRNAL